MFFLMQIIFIVLPSNMAVVQNLYNTNYYQRIVLESWFTNLEQTPINRCLQLPAPYKRLIDDINRQTTHWFTLTVLPNVFYDTRTDLRPVDGSKRTNHCLVLSSQLHLGSTDSRPITSRISWPITSTTGVFIVSTDVTQITWLWRWLPLRLSKRQSMSSQTVLLRTTLTRTIVLYFIIFYCFTVGAINLGINTLIAWWYCFIKWFGPFNHCHSSEKLCWSELCNITVVLWCNEMQWC